jgi:hypothetical protein
LWCKIFGASLINTAAWSLGHLSCSISAAIVQPNVIHATYLSPRNVSLPCSLWKNCQVQQYDAAVRLWQDLRRQLDAALTLCGGSGGGNAVWKTYWAAQQRFFKLLCIDLKLEAVLAEVGWGAGVGVFPRRNIVMLA